MNDQSKPGEPAEKAKDFGTRTMTDGVETLDSIVLGKTSRTFFEALGILPSQWRLPQSEIKRIQDAGILIAVARSPACELTLNANSFIGRHEVHLIILDKNSVENAGLTARECVATLLHEIGHVLNAPITEPCPFDPADVAGWFAKSKAQKEENRYSKEMLADDYACQCGYAKEVASSLRKLLAFDPKHFDRHQVERLIERIENGAQGQSPEPNAQT